MSNARLSQFQYRKCLCPKQTPQITLPSQVFQTKVVQLKGCLSDMDGIQRYWNCSTVQPQLGCYQPSPEVLLHFLWVLSTYPFKDFLTKIFIGTSIKTFFLFAKPSPLISIKKTSYGQALQSPVSMGYYPCWALLTLFVDLMRKIYFQKYNFLSSLFTVCLCICWKCVYCFNFKQTL